MGKKQRVKSKKLEGFIESPENSQASKSVSQMLKKSQVLVKSKDSNTSMDSMETSDESSCNTSPALVRKPTIPMKDMQKSTQSNNILVEKELLEKASESTDLVSKEIEDDEGCNDEVVADSLENGDVAADLSDDRANFSNVAAWVDENVPVGMPILSNGNNLNIQASNLNELIASDKKDKPFIEERLMSPASDDTHNLEHKADDFSQLNNLLECESSNSQSNNAVDMGDALITPHNTSKASDDSIKDNDTLVEGKILNNTTCLQNIQKSIWEGRNKIAFEQAKIQISDIVARIKRLVFTVLYQLYPIDFIANYLRS